MVPSGPARLRPDRNFRAGNGSNKHQPTEWNSMDRRKLVTLLLAGSTIPWLTVPESLAARDRTSAEINKLRTEWTKFLASGTEVVAPTPKLKRGHDEWRMQLPANAYDVLFKEETERPFTSKLNDEKRSGVYLCRACGLPLFTSAMKYDSGTGWPSFFTAIPGHLGTKTDYKLIWPRTEYHCVKCGGHQGHVFDDGPSPTNERWCNNGVALNFKPLQSDA